VLHQNQRFLIRNPGQMTGYPEVDRPTSAVYLNYFWLADHPATKPFWSGSSPAELFQDF
jgi:hypothetical protein